jgi:hypothetical protein
VRKQRLCQESPAPPKEAIVSYPLAAFVTRKRGAGWMGAGRPLEVPLPSMGISCRGVVIVRIAPKVEKGRSHY